MTSPDPCECLPVNEINVSKVEKEPVLMFELIIRLYKEPVLAPGCAVTAV